MDGARAFPRYRETFSSNWETSNLACCEAACPEVTVGWVMGRGPPGVSRIEKRLAYCETVHLLHCYQHLQYGALQ